MSVTENEIMTVQEVAEYLRLNEMTIYKLAQEGKLTALKIGRSWRFKKGLIDEWFSREAQAAMSEASDSREVEHEH